MNRLLLKWELLGIAFVIATGSALHFAFEWSGNWQPVALVAAVNESVWEHLKLAFWPGGLWALMEYAALKPNARGFWAVKGYALIVAPIVIVVLFYGYTAILGRNVFLLDIATFAIAVTAGQVTSARLLNANIQALRASSIGIGLLVGQLTAFSTFTFYPPPIGLFEDGRNGIRGIPSHALAPNGTHR